jgi:hypothetical protein
LLRDLLAEDTTLRGMLWSGVGLPTGGHAGENGEGPCLAAEPQRAYDATKKRKRAGQRKKRAQRRARGGGPTRPGHSVGDAGAWGESGASLSAKEPSALTSALFRLWGICGVRRCGE